MSSEQPMTSHSPVTATVNGRYRLQSWIGRSVLADEYLAHDLHLDRTVVFKALLPELVADRAFLDRFRNQAQATANLQHPAVAAVWDWGRDQGSIPNGRGAMRAGPTYYMVSEQPEGRALSELIAANGPMPPERVAHVIVGVTAALGFAHRAGVVDGGLRPSNIRISSSGVVKVIDLGLQRSLGSNWMPDEDDVDSAQWMAPEQFRGQAPSERTDVYQVGLLAYYLATGLIPYQGSSASVIRDLHLAKVPTQPTKANPEIPKALESFIGRSMAKAPDDRYSSITEQRSAMVRFRDRLSGSVSSNQRVASGAPEPEATAFLGNPSPQQDAVPTQSARAETASTSTTSAVTFLPAPANRETAPEDVTRVASHATHAARVAAPPAVGQSDATDYDGFRDSGSDRTAVQTRRGPINTEGDLPSGPSSDLDGLHRKSPRRALYLLTLLGLLAVLGVLLFLLAKQLGLTGSTTGTVDVPSVEQRPVAEAQKVLADLGLRVETQRIASGAVEADTVIKQTPVAGVRVAEGSLITLQVSTGSTQPTVPNVVGMTIDAAKSLLGQYGLQWAIREKPDDAAEAGTVTSQEPRADSPATSGATVTLTVAVSSSKKQVPKLDGKTIDEARVALTKEGFLIVVQSEPSNSVEKQQVIRTEPGGGTSVAKGSSVMIVVSGGKAIEVPSVIGKTEAEARKALQDIGLIVVVKERTELDATQLGKVVSQTPEEGDVEVGATVTIRIGVQGTVTTKRTDSTASDANGNDADAGEQAPIALQTVPTAVPATTVPPTPATTAAPPAPPGPVPAAAATTVPVVVEAVPVAAPAP